MLSTVMRRIWLAHVARTRILTDEFARYVIPLTGATVAQDELQRLKSERALLLQGR